MNLISLLDDLKAKREKAPGTIFFSGGDMLAIQLNDKQSIGFALFGVCPEPTLIEPYCDKLISACNSSETLETSLREAIEFIKCIDRYSEVTDLKAASVLLEKWGVGK